MKNLIAFIFCITFSSFAAAEFDWEEINLENIGLGDLSWDDVSWKNLTDMEGWTPRYSYVVDDNLIGRTHYMGFSFLKRQGAAHEGLTLRGGFGHYGEKLNLAYTSGFSLIGVDFGLSYLWLDKSNPRQHDSELKGLGLELDLRFWFVQVQVMQLSSMSYINLAYGF